MLEGHLFQLGYVCDDIDEGVAQFRGRGRERDEALACVGTKMEHKCGPRNSEVCPVDTL